VNNGDFLQWCASGQHQEVEHVLLNNHGGDLLWTVKFDDGFGAPTQSLVEQGIELSVLHNNRCWLLLLNFLAQHPKHLRAFVFGQLLYWDTDYQIKQVENNCSNFFDMLDTAFDLLDAPSLDYIRQSVHRYCLSWGNVMVEHLERNLQRKRILNQLTSGAEDAERKI